MKSSTLIAFAFIVSVCSAQTGYGQTSYPMIMSTKPTAAQVGVTSEVEVRSRYNLFGATQVIVTGAGVTGEVVPAVVKEGEKPPTNLTSLKVKFTVAADAKPGVRDFRLMTPRGASTLGQLVIVQDPVFSEKEPNNSADKAQEFTLPSTVCGCVEKAEDVDYFKFKVTAGQSLSFHVRSGRLNDRIHDMQTHADPIISIRNANGSTVATSDNYFFGDPFLSHQFEQAGDYLLEIRDVRYSGNKYWEYSIEINDRPFVSNVFPMGVAAARDINLELIGAQLPENRTAPFKVPQNLQPGKHWLRLPLANGPSNPVPVVVTDLPLVVEEPKPNNTAAEGQVVSVPAGISGSIESASDIDCYTFEAKKGEKFSIEVIARRHQSALDSIIRILNADGKRQSENDDMRLNKRGFADSLIENWTAPADGKFSIEIRDLHLRGGVDFVYFLKVTRSEPFFELYADTDKTLLTPGNYGVFFVRVVRKNGFTGEVQLNVEGLPEGLTAHCGRILADSGVDGSIVIEAKPGVLLSATNIVISGTGTHEVEGAEPVELSAVATTYQEMYSPGGGRGHWPVELHTISVGEPNDIRAVKISTAEISLKPGESQKIEVEIVRAEGFDKNVSLDVLYQHLGIFANALPKGVTVDKKNSKLILSGKESKGHITLKADDKAEPVEKQQISVMAHISINFVMKTTYASKPAFISVAKP